MGAVGRGETGEKQSESRMKKNDGFRSQESGGMREELKSCVQMRRKIAKREPGSVK